MRLFITGIGGFVGVHLADHLLAAGHEVWGLVAGHPDRPRLRALAGRHPRFRLEQVTCTEVTDGAALAQALAQVRPDGVFHLAGIAFAPRAAADAARALAVNTVGTMRVLEAAARVAPQARLLIVASSDVYGVVAPDDLPIHEATPLRPANVYGLSKAAADMAAFQRWWASGAAIIRVRAFNHTGPGQSADFVCSDFARQLARIESGAAPPVLRVGSVGMVRDFSDVRDIVRGYALLWERGTPGEAYNLCSGVGTSIGDIVTMLQRASGVTATVTEEPARLRGREIPAIVGSAERARRLGWSPAIPLTQTLQDLLDDWRERVALERG